MARKTNEQFLAEAKEKFPHIEVLSEYTDSKGIMKFRCSKHDVVFTKIASLFIHSKYGCTICAREIIRNARAKTPEWFKKELKALNPNVEQVGEYTTMLEKVKVKCVYCGRIFSSKAQDLLKGHSCKSCSNKLAAQNRIKDHNWFMDAFQKYNPNHANIEILSEYSGVANKVLCKCKQCSHEWSIAAARLIDRRGGSGCPLCNQSKGEMFVYNYLQNNNIEFEYQKEFSDLVGLAGYPLSYDFYIPSRNLLIEINGIQHYEPILYFGGTKKFRKQQEHDSRKREYAKKCGYELLEVKYLNSSYIGNIEKSLQVYL